MEKDGRVFHKENISDVVGYQTLVSLNNYPSEVKKMEMQTTE